MRNAYSDARWAASARELWAIVVVALLVTIIVTLKSNNDTQRKILTVIERQGFVTVTLEDRRPQWTGLPNLGDIP